MKLLTLSIMMVSFLSFSQVINPGENRGFIKLNFRGDITKTSAPVTFTFRAKKTNGNTVIKDFNKSYSVLKGEGCLISNTGKLLSWRYCGININAKQTTTLDVSVVKVSWNPEKLWVDLGKKVHFTLRPYVESTYDVFNFPVVAMQRNGKREVQSMVLPFVSKHKIQVSYSNVNVLKNETKTINPAYVSSANEITPRDMRGTINVMGEKLYFPTPGTKKDNTSYAREGSYKMLLYFGKRKEIRQEPINVVLHPKGSLRKRSKMSGNSQRTSWQRLDANETNNNRFSYKAFPLTDGEGVYEFLVNNINQRVDVNTARITTVRVKSLNIGLLEGKYDGFYRLYQLNPMEKVEKRQLGYANGCNLATWCSPGIDLRGFFPTKTTIEVPFGYTYQIDSYMKVHNGEMEYQDTMEVNL